MVLTFLKNTKYMRTILLIKLSNFRKKNTSCTMAHLTLFMHAFCHAHVENLLKQPEN